MILDEHIQLSACPEFSLVAVVAAKLSQLFACRRSQHGISYEDNPYRPFGRVSADKMVVLFNFLDESCGANCLVTLALKIPEVLSTIGLAISYHVASLFASRFSK